MKKDVDRRIDKCSMIQENKLQWFLAKSLVHMHKPYYSFPPSALKRVVFKSVFLRRAVSCFGFLVASLCIMGGGSLLLSLIPENSPSAHAAVRQGNSSQYVDAVIAMDNVSQIAIHDPDSQRFPAAQLFVDLAPAGDQIGTIKISGSHNPTQLSGYHALTNLDTQGRNDLKHTLSPQVFGPVEGLGDPNYPAYITPTLQAAGNMLNKSTSGNRRYVIIVTDAVARSGDQNNCQAPANHNWFCEVDNLEHQNISVVLIGFVEPGSENEFKPTQDYIQSHGGIVFPVEDGAGLSRRLALAYTDLLTRIHPTMFSADVNSAPSSLNIDQQTLSTSATFVALGDPGVSLSSLSPPGSNASVAGQNTSDGLYYSSPPGAGYWLETVSKGTLGGTWQLKPGSIRPSDILVIIVSEAHFSLENPASANPQSDVSVRYIAQDGPVVLHGLALDSGGQPLTNLPLIVNPRGDAIHFANNALPGYQTSDVEAILPQGGTQQIQVGLGNALISGIYLTKRFQLETQPGLTTTQLTVPVPALLPQGASIPISAQAPPGAITSLYGRDPSSDFRAFGSSGNTGASGDFPLTRGCGITYTFMAVSDISGDLPTGHYDYISFDQQTYVAQLQQMISGKADLPSTSYIEWWNSQPRWNVTFTSSTCTTQDIAVKVRIRSANFAEPTIAVANSSQYSLVNGSAQVTMPKNAETQIELLTNMSGCHASLFTDGTASIEMYPALQPLQGGPIVQEGTWQATLTCPSPLTNVRHHPFLTGASFFLFSMVISNLIYRVFPIFFRKSYLNGKIEYAAEALTPSDDEEEEVEMPAPMLVAVPIPRWKRLPIWYLDRRIEGEQIMYAFEPHESALSLLKFTAQHEPGEGATVKVEATKNAHGDKAPIFRITRVPVGAEPNICDGEPIEIGRDVIYPEIRIDV